MKTFGFQDWVIYLMSLFTCISIGYLWGSRTELNIGMLLLETILVIIGYVQVGVWMVRFIERTWRATEAPKKVQPK